jgi:DNA-binding transcriptional MocR family regulator
MRSVKAMSARTQLAQTHGIETPPLTGCALAPLARGGLLLGFAALTEAQIRTGVRQLRQVLQQRM